ncbi:MAG: PEP-CTERM system TPR-repeat protein PrsT [Gammaproteobacteria bacterium]|nr:PEP-CTERM system TPR-repeat protein PrsT [Gammaproteobacteria bacterium]
MMTIKKLIIACVFLSCIMISINTFSANYFEDAKQYLKTGNYNAAIIQLKNQLRDNPQDIDARFLLGETYLRLRDLKQANKEMGRAHELNPSNETISIAYARLLLLQKKYNKIDNILNIKFNSANNEIQSKLIKAYALLGKNKVTEAKQVFFELSTNTKNIHAYTGLAKIAVLENEIEKANQLLNKAFVIDPNDESALKIKAIIEVGEKNYDNALNIYTKLIEKQNNNFSLYINRASVKVQQQDFQGAKADLQIVLNKIKNHPHANYVLSEIHLKEKNYKAAEISAQKVLNYIPRHYNSMLILGVANYAQANYNQADKYLTQYLSGNPNNLMVQNILANVYLSQNNTEQAILILEGIDEEKRNLNATILTTLGTAYFLAGEHQKGLSFFSKAKLLKPDSQLINKKLIDGQLRVGDIQGAITNLENLANSGQLDNKIRRMLIVSYLQQKQYQKAEKKVDEFIVKTPNNPELYNLKAIIQKIKGNNQLSIDAYNQALKIDIKFIPAYLGLAELAIQQNDLETANNLYSKVIKIDPKYVNAYIYLAKVSLQQGHDKNVEQQLLKGLEQSEGNIKAQISVADVLSRWYARQETPEKLMPIAQSFIKKFPNDELAYAFLAASQATNKQYKQAEKTLRTIIKKNENSIKHRMSLVSLLMQESDENSEVYELLDTIIKIEPFNIKPLIIKSDYLLKYGHYQQAMALAEYTQEQFPKKGLGMLLKGSVYRAENKLDNALIHYQKAYQLQPNNKLLLIIFDILNDQGKEADALNLLEGELKGEGNDMPLLAKIATIYHEKKNYQQAIQFYKKMLEIQPDNFLILNNLALVYAQEENPEALILSKKAYELSTDSALVADTYGYIQLKMGSKEKALDTLKQAEILAPKNNDIKFHLAEAYWLNGELEKAQKLLNLILEGNKEFSEKESAKELLNKLQK